jgi:hypothetical protein
MTVIREILESRFFEGKPPVLIDIGASGEINAKWKPIAPYSVCIAFDADDREFRIDEKTNAGYKKLIVVNRIVTAEAVEQQFFHLTASPFCSSLLEPDEERLLPWVFKSLFSVERTTPIKAVTLPGSLNQAGISYVDWFKSDTQGTDLRLYTALPANLQSGILAAEFEPGIMDAYKGEDKLHMVMKEMDLGNFWLTSMIVKGTQRLKEDYAESFGASLIKRTIRKSPCWAEVTYLKDPGKVDTERQFLLLFVFALLERQYGFALEVMDHAEKKFNDPIFRKCRLAVLQKIRAEKWKVPLVVLKRQFNKLFSTIHD